MIKKLAVVQIKMVWMTLIGVMCLLQFQSVLAETWTACALEGRVCSIPDNTSQGVTVRYGWGDRLKYKFTVIDSSIVCDSSTFGADPMYGQTKACEYSHDANPQASIVSRKALHTIFLETAGGISRPPTFAQHQDSALFPGSPLKSLVGENRYELKMGVDGNLTLTRVDLSNFEFRTMVWQSDTADQNHQGQYYTFHVLGNGIEIRKNGLRYWHRTFGDAEDTNYIVHISDEGRLALDNMETGKRQWDSGWNGPDVTLQPETQNIELTHTQHKANWLKLGWTHVTHWSEAEARFFRTEMSTLPHHALHVFLKAAQNIGKYEANVIVQSIKQIIKHPILSPAEREQATINMARSIKQAARQAVSSWRILRSLSLVAGGVEDGTFKLREFLAPMVENVLNKDNIDIRQTISYLEGMGNRKLSANAEHHESEAPCGPLCAYKSREHMSGVRMDYALELAPTFIRDAFKNKLGVPKKWLDQVQLRLFMTHPRINGEGRHEIEIRLRFQGVSGSYGQIEDSLTTLGTDPLLATGIVGVHDLIFPFTWSPDDGEKFVNSKYEGLKYLSLGGGIIEVDAQVTEAAVKLINLVAEPLKVIDQIPGAAMISPVARLQDSATSNGIREFQTIMSNYRQTYPEAAVLEFGLGAGIYFAYDIQDMAENIHGVNVTRRQVYTTLIEVGMQEFFGSLGATVFLGAIAKYKGLSAEGIFAKDWDPLALVNGAIIGGGLLGDLMAWGNYKKHTLNEGSITAGGNLFTWIALRLNPIETRLALDTSLLGMPFSGAEIRARVQWNKDIWAEEWLTSAHLEEQDLVNIGEYGVYQFETKHEGMCVEMQRNVVANGAETRQTECNSASSFQLWQTNKTGVADDKNVFELRNLHNGFCLGVDETFGLSNGARTKQVRCDEVAADTVRWKTRQVKSDTVVFESSKKGSEGFCLDLAAGGSSDQTAMHMWECDIINQNQHFKAKPNLGIVNGGRHRIVTDDDQCIDSDDGLYASGSVYSEQRNCNGSDSQTWALRPKGNGFYEVRMSGSDDCLRNFHDGNPDGYKRVPLYQCRDVNSFKWKPEMVPQGDNEAPRSNLVRFRGAATDECMEVFNAPYQAALNHDAEGFLMQTPCNDDNPKQYFKIVNSIFEQFDGSDTNPGRGLQVVEDNPVSKLRIYGTRHWPSTYTENDAMFGAHKAIDSDKEGRWPKGLSVTGVEADSNPYWQGDLGKVQNLESIAIYNYVNPNGEQTNFKDFYVLISDTDIPSHELSEAINSVDVEIHHITPVANLVDDNWLNIYLPDNTQGRYVRIQRNDSFNLLFAEIEVYGSERAGFLAPPKLIDAKLSVTGDNVVEAAYMNGTRLSLVNGNVLFRADVFDGLPINASVPNVMAFELTDTGGIGGFLAELEYNGNKVVSDSSCKVVNADQGSAWTKWGFDDSGWPPATEIGAYGINPWGGNINGIPQDTQAKWIWSSDLNAHNKVYVRCVFLPEPDQTSAPAPDGGKLNFTSAKQIDIHQDDVDNKGPLKAIDGNTSGDPAAYSTAITYAASNTWWQGDLGVAKKFSNVTLYNTTGGGAYRLRNFYILVTDTDVEGMTLTQARNAALHEVFVDHQVPGEVGNNSELFDLGEAKGRYLVIYKEGVSHLHLAEVVALGEPKFTSAKQIDIHQDDVDNKGPLKATDGNTSGDPAAYSTAISYAASNTWWQGDMGVERALNGVTVYNTTGGGAYRLRNFYILVTNTDVEGMTVEQARNAAIHEVYIDHQVPGQVNNNSERFDLGGAKGRYLVIYKPGVSHLHLAEVVPD